VLLLDEIEKAHPDLFNVLLQIMDHGKLTDHNGKQVDFRNIILIMTTNAGASDLAKAAYGFTRSKREGDDVEAINRLFAPEFRNRLDATITFNHLSPEVIAKVVEKFVLQLEAQLADRDVTIELSEEAAKWLIDRGYDEQMGARPMARVIQEHIKKPLADEVLFGKLKNGGHVRVVVTKEDAGKPGEAQSEEASEDGTSPEMPSQERSSEDKPARDKSGKEMLGFEFLDGPVTPKPEKIPPVRPKGKRRGSGGGGGPRRAKPPGPRGDGGAPPPTRGSVPKIPLVKV
jgi:ATP-dependent Clp protease ATP-binding subunit ClpA